MAGYSRGPDPQVPREAMALVYLDALERGEWPARSVRERFGLTEKRYERGRVVLSRHGWLPHGRLTPSDAPRARAMFLAKLREVQQRSVAQEDEEARLVRVRELRALRAAAELAQRQEKAREVSRAPRGASSTRKPVLDIFGL